jgi:hypothetical protein
MNKNIPYPLSIKSNKIGYKLLTALCILVAFYSNAQVQNESPEKHKRRMLFTQGNLMMGEGFVDSALGMFKALYAEDTNDANVCYNIGQLYLRTEAHKAEAISYLRKAVKHVDKKWIPDDPYEKDAPPPVYYYLARAQHLNYEFDSAINNFTKFKNLLQENDSRKKDIDYWVACCNNSKELMGHPVDCKIVDAGDSINSRFPDFSPVVSADEQEILFTSRRPNSFDSTKDINGNYLEDIWMSQAKPGGGWTTAINIGPPVNTDANEISISLSPDGQQLIFYRESQNGGGGSLYLSKLIGYTWSSPDLIDSGAAGVINGSGFNPSACFSPDGKTIIFSSNRAGGLGGTDLYEISIGQDGKWSAPVNMGPSINTEYDEDAPFIHPDDSTLFFSSKGHNTMGGFDVFMTKEKPNSQWNPAENLGYPVNTPDDDEYFKLSADGRRGYYTSTRPGGYGERDIYEAIFRKPLPVQPVAVLVGYMTSPDRSGRLPNDINIVCAQKNGKYSASDFVNAKTGKFLEILRPQQTYNVTITTQGKRIFDHQFPLTVDSSYLSLSRAFFRTKMILGDTTNLFAPPATLMASTSPATVKGVAMTGRLLLNNDPLEPLSVMPLKLIDENGNVVQTIMTSPDGSFGFSNLPPDHKYGIRADLQDSKIKHLKKMYLENSNGQIVRTYDENKKKSYLFHDLPADLNTLPEMAMEKPAVIAVAENTPVNKASADGQPDFVRYFGYNIDDVSANDDGFTALINKITDKVTKGTVDILIDGSASKVPTTLFSSSNKSLAKDRSAVAKKVITETLKSKSIDISKVHIETISAVSGPQYQHDAKDESKYQKFQYVKVFVR